MVQRESYGALFFCINRCMSSNLTNNLNMLSPTGFKVTIDSQEYANLEFFCTTANVPSLSQSSVLQPFKNDNAYFPGDKIEYSTFDVTFIVDEELHNYNEILNWLLTNRATKPKFKDITLSILTNKNTTNRQVKFHDCFPVNLGELAFTTQDTALEYVTCSVTFQHNKFEFIR